jgi:undecaprenyl-diphosphatase
MFLDKSHGMQAASTVLTLRSDADRVVPASPRRFERLDAREIPLVRHQMALATRIRLASVAAMMNVLGNGWIYPPLGLTLLFIEGSRATRTILRSGLAVLVAHGIYACVKRLLARPRPYVTYGDIKPRREPLDRYSFPSGHCMTICAACLPIVAAHPATSVWLVPLAVGLAWSRVVAGHHYPSDVIAGALLGVAVCSAFLRLPL